MFIIIACVLSSVVTFILIAVIEMVVLSKKMSFVKKFLAFVTSSILFIGFMWVLISTGISSENKTTSLMVEERRVTAQVVSIEENSAEGSSVTVKCETEEGSFEETLVLDETPNIQDSVEVILITVYDSSGTIYSTYTCPIYNE